MVEPAFDLILENLKKLTNCKADLIKSEKDQIEFLYGELEFFRTFIKDWGEKPYENGKANNLLIKQIIDVANKAEDTIELFITNKEKNHMMMGEDTNLVEENCHVFDPYSIHEAIEAIKRAMGDGYEAKINEGIKTEELEIYNNKKHTHNIGAIQDGESSNRDLLRANSSLLGKEELVVGFDEETTMIKDQLTGGQKQLDVISIVGMPGIDGISDEKLGEKLRRHLKGKRYLIVMDDMWDTGAWAQLKSSFPNDNNGSRIMFTSRMEDVALQVKPDSHPLFLRCLNENESWDLFQWKAFQRQTCPSDLTEIGKEIVHKCQGVPLTIVVAAGILANKDKTLDQWNQVGKALSSSIVHQPCMETLALSYNHLPRHLKPCFLYFGMFPEDYEIPFHKLICLWIAEGFIREIGNKVVLEDLAEEYLLDLIGRSLVTVSKRRSDGGIKACHMHDLLRDFCLKKAKEEYFLGRITGELFPCPFRRLCIHPPISLDSSSIDSTLYTHSHSLLYIASRNLKSPLHFIYRCFTLLRVLDISSILIDSYSFVCLLQLVLLRYLALGFLREFFPYKEDHNINLINLETLILRGSDPIVVLPHSIWKMVKLRHLWFTGNVRYRIQRPVGNAENYPSSLDSLHTLSCVDPLSCQDILTRTPNLRKLGFRGDFLSSAGLAFPDIHFLNHLKKLKLINERRTFSGWSTNLHGNKFPSNLKSLTLESTYLKWDDMSFLSKLLPNLEVLKLADDACRGPIWETCGVFPRLRFLKFQHMKIREWKLLSSNYFPCLQRLVFALCFELERIPSEIGDIPTLQMIEVTLCSDSIKLSAKEIQEEQRSNGNNGLQIMITKS